MSGGILLIGDATTNYAGSADNDAAGNPVGSPFTCFASGVVDTLMLRTNGTANTGCTSVQLGVYNDVAGSPNALLGWGSATGLPAINSWVTVTGLSIPVIQQSVYWLVHLALGATVNWNWSVSTGGQSRAFNSAAASANTLAGNFSPWTPASIVTVNGLSPRGFQALGTPTLPFAPSRMPLGV